MSNEKNLYDLKLGEAIGVSSLNGSCVSVLRVPGGWVYFSSNGGGVFVPFNDEFMKGYPQCN